MLTFFQLPEDSDRKLKKMEGLCMGRYFEQQIIMRCARKYLHYNLSFRDLVEIVSAKNTIRIIPNGHAYTNSALKSELLQMKQTASLHVQPTIHM